MSEGAEGRSEEDRSNALNNRFFTVQRSVPSMAAISRVLWSVRTSLLTEKSRFYEDR